MMKLPNEETQENNHSDGDGYLSDDYEALELIPAPIRDGDFSEYMWMENEEEFNSQVMRELVEQELMEECIAVNEDYGTLPLMNNLTDSVNILSISSSNGVRSTNGSSNSCSSPSQNVPSSEPSVRGIAQQRLDRIRTHPPSQSQSQSQAGKEYTLNPDAKEFVPTSRSTASSSEDENDKLPS